MPPGNALRVNVVPAGETGGLAISHAGQRGAKGSGKETSASLVEALREWLPARRRHRRAADFRGTPKALQSARAPGGARTSSVGWRLHQHLCFGPHRKTPPRPASAPRRARARASYPAPPPARLAHGPRPRSNAPPIRAGTAPWPRFPLPPPPLGAGRDDAPAVVSTLSLHAFPPGDVGVTPLLLPPKGLDILFLGGVNIRAVSSVRPSFADPRHGARSVIVLLPVTLRLD
jgi:hypothetical protein